MTTLRRLTILPFLILSITIGFGQANFIQMEFTKFRHPSPGYYLIAPNSIDSVGLLDHGGKVVHAFAARSAVNLSWQIDNTISYLTDSRKYFRRDASLNVIDTVGIDDLEIDFHEFRVLANGNLLLLAYETRMIDMSAIVPNGYTSARVIGNVIREVTPSGDVVFEWSSFDHTNITDATEDIDLTTPSIAYIHINSVFEDLDGNLLVSARHFDAVLKIDRASGAVIWRLGGEKARVNNFTFVNDDVNGFTGFSHQHTVTRTSNGKLLMFDNGNLKPTQYSRAVIYDVNEQNMTATRLWEYRQTPDVYASAMGSAQELPSGSILVGWGSASTRHVATEVGADGQVEAEISTQQPGQVKSYRVMKAPFAMTAVQTNINAVDTFDLVNGDSSAHLAINVTALTQTTNLVVERHWNRVVAQSFAGDQPCLVLPARWSVRTNHANAITGTMSFNVGEIPGISVPDLVAIYHRPTEGSGVFQKVTGTYSAAKQTFTTTSFKTGEYVACYLNCMTPFLLAPANGTGGMSAASVQLAWSPATQDLGYQVQVSTSPTFVTTIVDQVVEDEEVLDVRSLASYTRYYWRVRTKRSDGVGQWSEVWSFRTSLFAPGPIAPRTDFDTVSVVTQPTLTWSPVGNATRYHVRIYRTSAPNVIVDQDTVTTTGWVTPMLDGNTWYQWNVRALADTASSAFSATVKFLTSPAIVQLRFPSNGQEGVARRNARLVWNRVAGATGYRLRVALDTSSLSFVDTVITDTTFLLPKLAADVTVHWRVRAIGRYGAGLWAPERTFKTAPEGVLAAPTLLSPADSAIVDRNATILRWVHDEATSYQVEIATSAAFDTIVLSLPSITVDSLYVPLDAIEAGRTYHWRVRGRSEQRDGLVSAPWTFAVATLPPPTIIGLQPLEPQQGSRMVATDGSFRWTRDSRVDGYEVLVFNGLSTTPEFTIASSDTVVAYAGLQHSTTYRWFVRGMCNNVPVDSGDVASFETEAVIAGVDEHLTHDDLGLHGSVTCDASHADIAVVDIAGRLIDRIVVPVVDGRWTYRPYARGVHIIAVTTCNARRAYLWSGR